MVMYDVGNLPLEKHALGWELGGQTWGRGYVQPKPWEGAFPCLIIHEARCMLAQQICIQIYSDVSKEYRNKKPFNT